MFTAEYAENAEVNQEKKVFSRLEVPTFGCALCALRCERYFGIFQVPKTFYKVFHYLTVFLISGFENQQPHLQNYVRIDTGQDIISHYA